MRTNKFRVGRILTDEEWAELKAARAASPGDRWRRGDIGPDGRIFHKYGRESVNGERWLAPEKFAITHAREVADNKRVRESDREAHNSYRRHRYAADLEKSRARSRACAKAYYWRNREAIRERTKGRAEKNTERFRIWREKNRERCRENGRAYRAKRPDIFAARDAIRRGLMVSFSSLSDEDKKRVRNLYILRNLLNRIHGKTVFHVDHIIPVSKGGKHEASNLRLTTAEFNLRKSNKLE